MDGAHKNDTLWMITEVVEGCGRRGVGVGGESSVGTVKSRCGGGRGGREGRGGGSLRSEDCIPSSRDNLQMLATVGRRWWREVGRGRVMPYLREEVVRVCVCVVHLCARV